MDRSVVTNRPILTRNTDDDLQTNKVHAKRNHYWYNFTRGLVRLIGAVVCLLAA